MKKSIRRIIIFLSNIVILLLVLKVILFLRSPIDKKEILLSIENPVTIRDRYGGVMAKFYPRFGGNHIPVRYDQLPENLIRALISCEDKRFYRHIGIDLLAIIRAARDNFKKGKIVSGGSTLTQQLVRNIYKLPRNYLNKLYEMLMAIRFEHSLSKKEIITEYLNRVYFGNSIYGIAAASKIYFGKHVSGLSVSESAFLIGILKSGIKYDPYKKFSAARSRWQYVLSRMYKNGLLNKKDHDLALHEGVTLIKYKNPFKAPHFCFYVKELIEKKAYKNVTDIRSTIDPAVQKKTEYIIKNHLKRLRGFNVNNASAVVLDAQTGEVLAMVGSLDYFDKNDAGQVNGASALRQPGSSLKPFLYAYVFTKGHSPADVISDIQTEIPTATGDYSPVNFDRKYHGPVSIRESLACSYNIPAVKWLYKYKTEEYISLLRNSGLDSINKGLSVYGVGIALGTAEVSLLKLANAYTVFANEGSFIRSQPIKYVSLSSGRKIRFKNHAKKRVLSEDIVYLINHILTDRNARLKAFPDLKSIIYPFDVAIKTGTSKDYRDAWAIGYTKEYIAGVWLGNFKGKSMNRITGGNGSVPIIYDIFLELNPGSKTTVFPRPENIITMNVCPTSGNIASGHCPCIVEEVFIKTEEPKKICNNHKLYYSKKEGKGRKKVFNILPSEYSKWSRENEIEKPGIEWETDEQEDNKEIRARVIYPDNGDIFRIDPVLPKEYQRIELKADIPSRTEYVEWYVNNNLWKKVKNGEYCKWRLKRGNYSFYVKALLKNNDPVKSKSVKILVH